MAGFETKISRLSSVLGGSCRFRSLTAICKCNRINVGFSLFLYAGDEEWDDGNEQNVLEAAEQDNETTAIKRECYLLDCRLSWTFL